MSRQTSIESLFKPKTTKDDGNAELDISEDGEIDTTIIDNTNELVREEMRVSIIKMAFSNLNHLHILKK